MTEDVLEHLQPAYHPPMENGEVCFESPWESRIFGMAVALHNQGAFQWSTFQTSLIAHISEWEQSEAKESASEYPYFVFFQRALEHVVTHKDLLGETELEERTELFEQRPHGHDHTH